MYELGVVFGREGGVEQVGEETGGVGDGEEDRVELLDCAEVVGGAVRCDRGSVLRGRWKDEREGKGGRKTYISPRLTRGLTRMGLPSIEEAVSTRAGRSGRWERTAEEEAISREGGARDGG